MREKNNRCRKVQQVLQHKTCKVSIKTIENCLNSIHDFVFDG